jgi:hypothetical protein
LSRAAIRSDAGFAVDNLDLVGVFAEGGIVEDEVRAGLFDGAEIRVSFVNWEDPDGHGEIRLRRGTLGETRLTPQGYFHAELRGLAGFADGWFDEGAVTFETGANAGRTIEVKSWTQSIRRLELWAPTGLPVEVDDQLRIYPGCHKRVLEDCRDRFRIRERRWRRVRGGRRDPGCSGLTELAEVRPNLR